ncbi:MAG: hypothetical protein WA101_01630 [Minisyncoccia bacterium]
MKKLIIFALILIGLKCFGQGEPVAPYNENGYSIAEASNKVSHDSVLAIEYCSVLQKYGEMDGWINKIKNGKMTLNYTIFFLERLTEGFDNWNEGEVSIGSRTGTEIKYFFRSSYSERISKTAGLEPVGILDITAVTGWKDQNGNSFPVRILMARRCVNSVIDLRSKTVISSIQPEMNNTPNQTNQQNQVVQQEQQIYQAGKTVVTQTGARFVPDNYYQEPIQYGSSGSVTYFPKVVIVPTGARFNEAPRINCFGCY